MATLRAVSDPTSDPATAKPRFDGLVLASNRLPVVVSVDDDGLTLEPSSGGLVAALSTTSEPHLWVGWPGAVVPVELERSVTDALAEESCVPVFLSAAE